MKVEGPVFRMISKCFHRTQMLHFFKVPQVFSSFCDYFLGLGKSSVFGSVYGGITAQSNNSQVLQKKHKKSAKYDDLVKPFPDSVTQ